MSTNPVKPASDIINDLIAVILAEVTELTSQSAILQYIPRIASAIHPVAIPGAEKKTLVIQALHTLLSKLFEADKITKEFKELTDAFVDEVAPITIDTIINVASGKVAFTKEQAVEVTATVVSTGCKICLPFLMKKLTKKAAPETAAAVNAATAIVVNTVSAAATIITAPDTPPLPATPASTPTKEEDVQVETTEATSTATAV